MSNIDRCANYNAFGHDPDGLLAYVAMALWGPNYVPPFPSKVFGGPPEPPRYGPPAAYQRHCLPPGWTPTPPPGPAVQPLYLDPPAYFDAEMFDALRFGSDYVRNTLWNGNADEDEDGDELIDTDVDEEVYENAFAGSESTSTDSDSDSELGESEDMDDEN